jgi:transcriptional regulator with XRE-family HTH domain
MPKNGPDPSDVHVGKRVRMRRMMLGRSQTQLGEALGITFQQVQKHEKGTNRISASRLQQISETFQVPVGFFFEGLPDGAGRHAPLPRRAMYPISSQPRTGSISPKPSCEFKTRSVAVRSSASSMASPAPSKMMEAWRATCRTSAKRKCARFLILSFLNHTVLPRCATPKTRSSVQSQASCFWTPCQSSAQRVRGLLLLDRANTERRPSMCSSSARLASCCVESNSIYHDQR